jgi:hypothetical protein
MEAIKRIFTVPITLEITVKLPDDAIPNETAEVIVLYRSKKNSIAEKLAFMESAKNDDLYLSDIREIEEDFSFADAEIKL